MKLPWQSAPEAELGTVPVADRPSLELLYRRHFAWLLRQVRKRFGRDLAEDLVQETYIRAAAYQGREVRNPRGLLLQIATRTAIDWERRRAVRAPISVSHEAEAVTVAEQVEALSLKQVILALPPHLKQVFLLSRVAGLTYEEIAAHCGISVKTVEWRMTKAIKLCAAVLAGEGGS